MKKLNDKVDFIFKECSSPKTEERLAVPVSFDQGILVFHSKIEDAQTCISRDAGNKAAIK